MPAPKAHTAIDATRRRLWKGVVAGLVVAMSIDAGASNAQQPTQLQLCKKFLRFGVTAQLLENTCKIRGPVSKRALSIYEEGDCRHIVPQNDVDAVMADVSNKLQTQVDQPGMGIKNFCAVGRDWYHEKLDSRHWFDHDPDRATPPAQ